MSDNDNPNAGREPAENNGSAQEPTTADERRPLGLENSDGETVIVTVPDKLKRAGGPSTKRRLVDSAVVGAHEAERRTKRLLDEVKEEREARVVTLDPSASRMRELLKRQAALPRVTEEEADRRSHDPNAFPPEVLQLMEQRRYKFMWVTNPYAPGKSESDRQIAAHHLRAMSAGGIWEVATQSALGDELPDYLYDSEGVISRSGQILAFVDYEIWSRRREAERQSADAKLKASEEGKDEHGQVPHVQPTRVADMGLHSEPIPDQPGLGAQEWEGGHA